MHSAFATWLGIAKLSIGLVTLSTFGCTSANYAQRGTGLGALAGAGAGAIVADATGGHAGTGALIGAGLGAVTGATVGSEMDIQQAQYRADIAAQMGRQVQAGAASIDEVIAMTKAGVDPLLIQNYVRTSGVIQPLSAADVIYLHNQGISTDVIQVMQTTSVPAIRTARACTSSTSARSTTRSGGACWKSTPSRRSGWPRPLLIR